MTEEKCPTCNNVMTDWKIEKSPISNNSPHNGNLIKCDECKIAFLDTMNEEELQKIIVEDVSRSNGNMNCYRTFKICGHPLGFNVCPHCGCDPYRDTGYVDNLENCPVCLNTFNEEELLTICQFVPDINYSGFNEQEAILYGKEIQKRLGEYPKAKRFDKIKNKIIEELEKIESIPYEQQITLQQRKDVLKEILSDMNLTCEENKE